MGEVAPQEQFLPLCTIFYYLMLDFYVKTGSDFLFKIFKRLFEITEVEITRVDCIFQSFTVIHVIILRDQKSAWSGFFCCRL